MEKYLITGATGYIGSMFTKELLRSDAKITAIVRNRDKAKVILGERPNLILGDITDERFMDSIVGNYDYILHFAATTKSAEMVSSPLKTLEGIVCGTKNVLELAKRNKVKSMVFISSMEVYGNLDCSDGHGAGENELGEIDLFRRRSCYPLGKRMAEHLCYLYNEEYDVPVKIARIAQTFGEGLLPGENRIFAQFARAVIEKKDIVLHTEGLSMGNYCEINDVIRALRIILNKGENGEPYNVVNESNSVRIRDMAEMVVHEIANDEIKVVYETDGINRGYAADTQLRMSGEKLSKLGFKAEKGLKEMYLEMIEDMRSGIRSYEK